MNKGHSRHYWAWFILGLLVLAAFIAFSYYAITNRPASTGTAQSMIQQSNSAFDQNDFQSSIADADAVLATDPTNVSALIEKAAALAQEGSLTFQEQTYGQQAIAVAQQALAIDPQSDEAWRIIGYANEIMQNYPAAHQAYEKAITINPKNAAALSGNAHAYDLQGDFKDAEIGYQQALAVDSTLGQALTGMGRIYVRQGDLNQALSEFLAVASSSPNVRERAEGAYSAGLIYDAQSNHTLALQFMLQATTVDPSYALAWTGLAKALFDQAIATSSTLSDSQREQAIGDSFNDLQQSVTLDQNQSAAHFQLGMELATVGRTSDALVVFKGLESIVPKDITLSAPDKQSMLSQVTSIVQYLEASSTKQ